MASNHSIRRPTLTTAAGIPVDNNQNSLTAGPRGPLLVQGGGASALLADRRSSPEASAPETPRAA